MKPCYWILIGTSAALLLLAGCRALGGSKAGKPGYTVISQETARQMMAEKDGHVVLDVRRQEEYEAGHIPGAILLPNESITDQPPAELPDKDQILLIYCRSGNRSKQAARKLSDMGYTRVYEFGGILTWTGEIVTGSEDPTAPAGTQAGSPAEPEATVTETQALSRLFLARNGSIAYPAFEITREPEGYVLTVNEDETHPLDEADAAAILDVVTAYDLVRWDGFSKSNSDVLDGEGFRLELALTDGTTVQASGDNAFPPRYHEAMAALWTILMRAGGWAD